MKHGFYFLLVICSSVSLCDASKSVQIPNKMKVCTANTDCQEVDPRCDSCCGVDAINAKFQNAFKALHGKTCANYQGGVCDCMPAPHTIECLKGKCTVVPKG